MKIGERFTERTPSLMTFFSEVKKYPLLTVEEEIELAVKIRQGDEEAKTKLINSNLRFVISAAKQYQNLGLSLGDLINEGSMGLIRAAELFDETRGFKFTSYAVWWIRNKILTAVSAYGNAMRLPLHQVAILNKINKAILKLNQELGREPELFELVKETQLPELDVKRVLDWYIAYKPTSLDMEIGQNDDFKLSDIITDYEETDQKILDEENIDTLNKLLSLLDPREKDVLIKRLGLFGQEKMKQIEVAKEYGVTGTTIGQVERRAMRRLKVRARKINFNNFEDFRKLLG